jgi:hypothetical protein
LISLLAAELALSAWGSFAGTNRIATMRDVHCSVKMLNWFSYIAVADVLNTLRFSIFTSTDI